MSTVPQEHQKLYKWSNITRDAGSTPREPSIGYDVYAQSWIISGNSTHCAGYRMIIIFHHLDGCKIFLTSIIIINIITFTQGYNRYDEE